jgi:hypothetical protein
MANTLHNQKTIQNSWKSEIFLKNIPKKKKIWNFFLIFFFYFKIMNWGLKVNHEIEGITNCEITKCGNPLYCLLCYDAASSLCYLWSYTQQPTRVRNIWSLAPLVLKKREKLTKIITYYTLLLFWSASLGFSRQTELGSG